MMLHEFVERTGFEPMPEEYAKIEEAYYHFEGSKDDFCKRFVAEGAEKMVYQARAQRIEQMRSAQMETERDMMATIARNEKRIAELEAALECEQEWKPYENEHNVSQKDYTALAGHGDLMSDEEAIILIVEETGFDRAKIEIIHELPKEQISRHNKVRSTGETMDRRPVYAASDWNYVRFDVRANVTRSYEFYNDELRPYWN